jgi:hypothetical protein
MCKNCSFSDQIEHIRDHILAMERVRPNLWRIELEHPQVERVIGLLDNRGVWLYPPEFVALKIYNEFNGLIVAQKVNQSDWWIDSLDSPMPLFDYAFNTISSIMDGGGPTAVPPSDPQNSDEWWFLNYVDELGTMHTKIWEPQRRKSLCEFDGRCVNVVKNPDCWHFLWVDVNDHLREMRYNVATTGTWEPGNIDVPGVEYYFLKTTPHVTIIEAVQRDGALYHLQLFENGFYCESDPHIRFKFLSPYLSYATTRHEESILFCAYSRVREGAWTPYPTLFDDVLTVPYPSPVVAYLRKGKHFWEASRVGIITPITDQDIAGHFSAVTA